MNKYLIFGTTVLALMLAGCAKQISEDAYVTFVNQELDAYFKAMDDFNNSTADVSQNKEFWKLKDPAVKQNDVMKKIISDFNGIIPPDSFKKENDNLIAMIQDMEQSDNDIILYSKDGNDATLQKAVSELHSSEQRYQSSVFSHSPYRRSTQ